MTESLVSVIIPAFNAEKYITECINSVINQTYKSIEIIIIDDGSNDSTTRIIDEYANEYTNVHAFHKKNEGVSVARNLGMEYAKGQYITFVDADDYISPSFVSDAVDVLLHFQADIVLGNTVYCAHNSELIDKTEQKNTVLDKALLISDISIIRKKVLGNGREKGNPLNGVFTSGPVCKLFRASILEGHKFSKELKVGEDTVFNLEVLNDTNTFVYVPCDWYYYRLNEDSATQKFNPEANNDGSNLINRLFIIDGIKGEEYSVYYQERTIQQFNGVLASFVMHPDNDIKIVERIRLIDDIISNSPWKDVFEIKTNSPLPGNIYDKVLFKFCRRKASFSIFVWARIRELLLIVRNKLS